MANRFFARQGTVKKICKYSKYVIRKAFYDKTNYRRPFKITSEKNTQSVR